MKIEKKIFLKGKNINMSVATYDRKKSKVKEENLAEFIVGDLSIKKPLHKTDGTRSCKLRLKKNSKKIQRKFKKKN